MDKKPLIGVCICAVVLLVMASLSNVVGYQTLQTSQQNIIKERINQRELAFQTICDIANNKEIQRIILKSQMSRGIFPTSEFPVVTKNQLKQMFLIGIILSKFISKSRIQSMVQQNQLSNPEIQQEINAVIEKDATLNREISQLKDSECDCQNEIYSEKISTADIYDTPIICGILDILLIVCLVILSPINYIFYNYYNIEYRLLAFLFLLITFPIRLLFSIVESITVILILLFNCVSYPHP